VKNTDLVEEFEKVEDNPETDPVTAAKFYQAILNACSIKNKEDRKLMFMIHPLLDTHLQVINNILGEVIVEKRKSWIKNLKLHKSDLLVGKKRSPSR
jgi:hypothetical protein